MTNMFISNTLTLTVVLHMFVDVIFSREDLIDRSLKGLEQRNDSLTVQHTTSLWQPVWSATRLHAQSYNSLLALNVNEHFNHQVSGKKVSSIWNHEAQVLLGSCGGWPGCC